jgi:hypothetical protein
MAVNINIPSQVKTYANLAAFPASGSLKTIYIAEDTNNTYRWDGSTYVEISASAATGLTIGTTPISSGTNGRVLFQGTGNVLQQSSSLFWDGTNSRLGIGTSSPTNILTLGAAVAASLQSSAASIFTSNENASNVFVQVAASNDPVQRPVFAGTKARGTLLSPTAVQSGDAITTFLSTAFDGTAGQASAGLSFDAESNASSGNAPQLISFITGASGGTRTTKMQVRSNGNVLINTTTDAGFRLDVNGTARVQGIFSALNASNEGIRLRNDTGSLPSIEFWQAVIRASITRETNNGLTFNCGGFAMHTVTGGTIIGGTSRNDLNASAQLQVQSTTKGFLPPRMTTTQKNAIASPATGLQVYDTTLNQMSYYNGTTWTNI